jgi:predicted lysophospholipase L1 biosynthesis ABC-type transport system permease subunit
MAQDVRKVDERVARYLQLSAIVALIFAVIAVALEAYLASTALFMVAAVGFLVTLILQKRR